MFSLHDFIKDGFMKAVGKRPDYWIILNAAGWADKGVLLEEDLADIQSAINANNPIAQTLPDGTLEENTTAESTPEGNVSEEGTPEEDAGEA